MKVNIINLLNWRIIILFYYVTKQVRSDKIDAEFTKEFFQDKNYMVTAHICWKYADIAYFLNNTENPKQVAIYRQGADYFNFLEHLSLDNFFVLDLNCKHAWTILQLVNHTLAFRAPLKFLLLVSDEVYNNRLVEKLANYTIYPSTEMVVAKRVDDIFQLYQPYRIDGDHEIIWENYGYWNSSGMQEYLKNIPISNRRYNLMQAKMNVVFFIEFDDTWNHLDDFKVPRIDTFTKQNYGAIAALMEYCHVNFTHLRTKNYGYYNHTTEEWSGLVDILAKGKAQIAGSSPYFTPERFTVVDFIKMQNPLQIRFLMLKPPLSYIYNIFTLPFQTNVWIALLISIICFIGILLISLNWESKHNAKINDKEEFTPSDISLLIFEALCQQGTALEPKSFSARVVTLFMFLSFMLLYISYSAYIVVILQSTHTIKSYKELLDSNMKVGGMETSYMRVYLSGSKLKIQQQLYERKIGPKGYYPLEIGMAKLHEGFFAFHTELAAGYDYILQKFTDSEICNLQEMEGYGENFKGYTGIPKNSAYKEIFKVGLLKVDEYGIQRRNNLRYLRPPKCYSGGGSFSSVGITDAYQGILLFAYGILVAIILLFIEILVQKRNNYLNDTRKKNRFSNDKFNIPLKNNYYYKQEKNYYISKK